GKGSGMRAWRKGAPHRDRVLVQEFPSEEDAFLAEKFLIAFYGRKDLSDGCLINLTDGGEGFSGLIFSNEHVSHLSVAHLGGPAYWKGKSFPEEFKQMLSDIHIVYPTQNGQAWCSYKKHYTDVTNFRKHPTSRRGLQGYCEECNREDHRIRYKKR